MKTFAFVVEVVTNEDQDKTFIIRLTNGNVIGVDHSVGSVAECIDQFTDPVPAAEK